MMNGSKGSDRRPEVRGDRNRITPDLSEGVIEKGKLYAFDNKIRSLCVIDLSDMTMRICARCGLRISIYVRRIFLFEELILMQLYQGARLLLYDRRAGEFTHCDGEQPEEALYNILPLEQEIFLIPLLWDNTILIFDLQDKSFKRIVSDGAVLREGSNILRPFVKGREILFPTQREPALYCLNADGMTIEKRPLSDHAAAPYIATWDGERLWYIEKHPRVLHCFDGGQAAETAIPEGEYGNIVSLSEHICIMPRGGSDLLVVSKGNGKVTPVSTGGFENRSSNLGRLKTGTQYVYCAEDEERIWFFPNDGGRLFILNKADCSTEVCVCFCEDYKKRWRELQSGEEGVLHESSDTGLGEFMEML